MTAFGGRVSFTGVRRYRKLRYIEFYPLPVFDWFPPFCCYGFCTWLLLHAESRIKADLTIVVAILISVSPRPTNSCLCIRVEEAVR